MKTLTKCCLFLILSINGNNLFAQVKRETADDKSMMDYMKPGAMHEMMAKSAGLWNEEVTLWMSADASPVKSTLNCMNKMIMGNRYLQGMNRGIVNGMPFEGISTVGYDNIKKVFVSTWIDNMGTGIMYTEGQWNEANKSIEFTGKQADPMTGKEVKLRNVMKFIDDNNQSLEMYMTPAAGKEFKNMEIKYTRKASPPVNNGKQIVPASPPVNMDEKK